MGESWEVCECKWSFVSRSLNNWSRPPGRRLVVAEPSEWVRIARKSVRMCLFGVKVVASRFLMCMVGYGMGES